MFFPNLTPTFSVYNANSYWIGSQALQQPIYQYRLILPFDDGKVINVASDVEMNSVEGEVKVPLASNIMAKSNFVVSAVILLTDAVS